MNLNHLVLTILTSVFIFGCTQPIGSSLLSNYSSTCDPLKDSNCDSSGSSASGQVEINATNSVLSVPMEDGEQVEIAGTCIDQGHKNNRILVEVYAGEDESSDPYISNAINDLCYPSTNSIRSGLEATVANPKSMVIGTAQGYTFSGSGGTAPYTYAIVLGSGAINAGTGAYVSGPATGTDIIEVTDASGQTSRSIVTVLSGITTPAVTTDNKKCFSVTRGIGLVEDAGLPTERTFPQCHNGQFGFSVRLGKVLANPTLGQPNYKYMVRYKLRALDGTNLDSVWGKVVIDRALSTPIVESVTNVHASQKCTIKTKPARFNPGILYTLTRTYTDILATNAGTTNLYTNANTLGTVVGTSVFEWDDVGLVDGVTYNYTLTSTDANYGYSPTPPTSSSSVVSCTTKRINVAMSATPVSGTCYMGLKTSAAEIENTIFNPYVTYEWGYSSTNSGWIGADGKSNSGYTAAACGNTAVCTEAGLTVGSIYYFALRAKNLVTGEIGIWSPVVPCSVTN